MAEIIKINDNTFRIEDDFVRLFLLEGKERAALIDSGVNCPNAKEIAESLTDKPVILINTHGDGDHTSGTAAFNEIYMHPYDYMGCDINNKFPNTLLHEIDDNDRIDLGGRPLRIIHIPGHTKGSIAILDINNRVLLSGDSVQKGHIYMFGSHRNPEQFEMSLEKLIAIKGEYDVIHASHDEYKLPNDHAEKVKEAWGKVRRGEALYEEANLFGNTVKSYTLEACGFFME